MCSFVFTRQGRDAEEVVWLVLNVGEKMGFRFGFVDVEGNVNALGM